MKKLVLLGMLATVMVATACKKDSIDNPSNHNANVPAEVQGSWMFGNFSMTEYWSQYPGDYLGNAFTAALAFQFEKNGKYTHYFTSSTTVLGVTTYHQSVTKGTFEVDAANKIIKTHPVSSHYKRTKGRQVEEDRDLNKSEINSGTTYTYASGVEPSGSKALYLTLNGTGEPLTFIQK